ncbi:hypothetical protein MMC11_008579 [Xylographa trunciseda]|nr:hypothetical protein [Xylographa trunciseda]
MTQIKHTSILILGAGWTSTFLIPLLETRQISYAATSTTGRPGTLPFKFDPSSPSLEPYHLLPSATTVLITFPLKGPHQSTHLLSLYHASHPDVTPKWIQLGSTGIFQIADQELWVTRHSKYDVENARAVAEDELLALGGCVLNLSGLWGGARQPRDFVKRVATSKEQLKGKTSLHMVHGMDVARAVVAVHENFSNGERWMLTDMFVYDWWALILGWGEGGSEGKDTDAKGPHLEWVRELMVEENARGNRSRTQGHRKSSSTGSSSPSLTELGEADQARGNRSGTQFRRERPGKREDSASLIPPVSPLKKGSTTPTSEPIAEPGAATGSRSEHSSSSIPPSNPEVASNPPLPVERTQPFEKSTNGYTTYEIPLRPKKVEQKDDVGEAGKGERREGLGQEGLKLRLELNLDMDIELKASIHGDIVLAVL